MTIEELTGLDDDKIKELLKKTDEELLELFKDYIPIVRSKPIISKIVKDTKTKRTEQLENKLKELGLDL